jgi:hypothetical protein
MLNTVIINAVPMGTGASIGFLINPVKTTLQATTSTLKTNVQITLGSTSGGNQSSKLKVWHAVSPNSYASALIGALALAQDAEYVEIRLDQSGTAIIERSTDVLLTTAGYHYCWVEMPTLTTNATLLVTLMELP